jgi:hypothetical protein
MAGVYAGFIERFAQCHHPNGMTAIRFPDDQPIELMMQHNARFRDLTCGLEERTRSRSVAR